MEPTRKPTSHIAPFGLRMQDDLRTMLEDAAKISGRSLNAEIVARLRGSFLSDRHVLEARALNMRVHSALDDRAALEKKLDSIQSEIEKLKAYLDSKKKPIKP